MKKLLLLGGSHSEIPLIKAAKKMGYYVITTGNQTDGLGHPYGDLYINCDFSDKEAICALAKEQKVDAVVSGCNDFAYLSAAYTCEKLGLPGHDSFETAKQIHHKDRYRALAEELGIITPKAIACETLMDATNACAKMNFPVIVKPIDLTGGKGMMRCESLQEVRQAYKAATKATRENRVLVEEFVLGTNHGFSAYIQNGKVTFYFFDDEYYYINPYLVSGACAPGLVSRAAQSRLVKDCEKMAGALKLKDGILHIQFVLQDDDTPVIIEVCRRAPGDLYVKLVEDTTEVDYAAYIVAGEAGISMPKPKPRYNGFYVRHCVMADRKGVIKSVYIDDDIKSYIYDSFLWYEPGDVIEDELKYKAGIVFLHFRVGVVCRKYLEEITNHIHIEFEDE